MGKAILPRPLAVGMALLTIGAIWSVCEGHCAPPGGPPLAPAPPAIAEVVWVYPLRWSWLHWWEANRDPYLETIRQGRPGQKPEQKVVDRYRAQAVEALLAATKSPHWQVRASAALALGRMGEVNASGVLTRLAGDDEVPGVRVVALVALGLLDEKAAGRPLLRVYPVEALWEAALAGLGLMSEPGPHVVVMLQRTLAGGPAGASTISAWALKHQPDPKNRQFLQGVLERRESPWLACEAILALGRSGDAGLIQALAKILLAQPQATESLPAWQALESRHKDGSAVAGAWRGNNPARYKLAYDQYVKKYQAWQKRNPNAPGPQEAATESRKVQVVLGVSRIYRSRLRASAAIALGQIADPTACRALREALNEHNDEYSDLYKGFILMSLGRQGDVEALPALLGLLHPDRDASVPAAAAKPDSPLRGYAAVALGLYARPVRTPQGLQDRPHYEKVRMALAERLADRNEELEVRSACALALGLTGRTENLKLLQAAGKTIAGSQEILIGYTLLARGMLADANICEPAKKFLAVARDRTDTAGILARRAAVLGLGVLGRQEGIPTLIDAWDLSYYVNREVALAFSLCEVYGVTDPLVKLLTESDKPLAKAFAAQCLGELFTRTRPQRLARILNDSNYTMKNRKMFPFQMLANEFLFRYLIPATEAATKQRWQ